MANSFSKEERVAFEQILQGFEDALVLSRNVDIYKTDQTMMERTGNTIWRPQPYIAQSFTGSDMTANFIDQLQLSVPATLGYQYSVPWIMTQLELRDALQNQRLGEAARQKLASEINIAVMTVAAQQGTLVYKSSSAASGFANVAAIEAIMNRNGIQGYSRYLALSTTDYNGLATDLANRQNMIAGLTETAYQRAKVGMIAGFDTYKLDYALRTAAEGGGGGLTLSTLASANNYWVPAATSVAASGQRSNVDNRTQQITVSSTVGVAAGDALTVAGVDEVHHITKLDTGSLKTFRVASVDSGVLMTISPPIISAQGGSAAELQYQNCIVTPSSTAAITFLNTAAGNINPFWQKGAIELMPGRYVIEPDSGVGVMRATSEQGIELVMTKQFDINTLKTKYRLDTFFGVTMLQPEMAGIALFSMP